MQSLEFFWEQADQEGLADHPLEVELIDRIDALARYRDLLADAESSGRDDIIAVLTQSYDREAQLVRDLRAALLLLRSR